MSTLDPDVVHYFLPLSFPPIRGADALARYWIKYKQALDPLWRIDHLLAHGDEVVIKWSCQFTPPTWSLFSPARLQVYGVSESAHNELHLCLRCRLLSCP
jgi:SnoaL-like domain